MNYVNNSMGLAGMFLPQSQGGIGQSTTFGQPTAPAPTFSPYSGDPFGSAMSGTKKGTLQEYINRMTQQGSNALYGGLLNYQPQSFQAGNAGGTPMPSQVPEGFNLPSAIPQGLLSQFGNRSWMNQGANNGLA
jgi:hypothetical protein